MIELFSVIKLQCGKLFEEIDKMQSQYLDILEDVCNIESPTSCKENVDAVGKYFIEMATKKGWDIEIEKQAVSGDIICITLNPDSDNSPITVSGHIDTVHPIGSFGTPAVRRDNANMYGPGVMDCKGGVVAAFLAMDALSQCGFKNRPVQLIIQSDEENGSRTSNKATIKYMCKKSENSIAFFNLEGNLKDTAVISRKGILQYRYTVHGKALHSSRCPDAANAVAEAASKILKLEELKNPDGLTCNCGVISGGTVPNSVAGVCIFYADFRYADSEQLERARQTAKQVAESTRIEGCSCDIEEINYRPAMPLTEKNEKLLEQMNKIYSENGLPVLTGRSCLSGSDAAYITECGIPCIDSIGTMGKNIHSTDEYIELASLAQAAKRIASVIYCL